MSLLIVTSGCTGSARSDVNGKLQRGETKVNVKDSVFGLTAEEFYSDPLKTENETIEKLEEEDFRGIAIGGPLFVNVEERSSFPLVIAHMRSFEEISRLQFDHHAILVARNLDTWALACAPVVDLPDNIVEEEPPPSDAPLPEGHSSEVLRIDARERLELSWSPGRYVVSVILWDSRSNALPTLLGTGELKTPEKISQEACRNAEPLATVLPKNIEALPVDSPKNGLSVSIDKEEEKRYIKIAAMLPYDRSSGCPGITLSEENDKDALIRVNLVFLHRRDGLLGARELAIPAHIEDGTAKSNARFNLKDLAISVKEGDDVVIYAFCGPHESEPVRYAGAGK